MAAVPAGVRFGRRHPASIVARPIEVVASLFAIGGVVGAMAGVARGLATGSWDTLGIAIVFTLVGLVARVSASRFARLGVYDVGDRLHVAGLIRDVEIPWADIAEVSATAPVPFRGCFVVLRHGDGSSQRVHSSVLGSLGLDGVPQDAVEALRRRSGIEGGQAHG